MQSIFNSQTNSRSLSFSPFATSLSSEVTEVALPVLHCARTQPPPLKGRGKRIYEVTLEEEKIESGDSNKRCKNLLKSASFSDKQINNAYDLTLFKGSAFYSEIYSLLLKIEDLAQRYQLNLLGIHREINLRLKTSKDLALCSAELTLLFFYLDRDKALPDTPSYLNFRSKELKQKINHLYEDKSVKNPQIESQDYVLLEFAQMLLTREQKFNPLGTLVIKYILKTLNNNNIMALFPEEQVDQILWILDKLFVDPGFAPLLESALQADSFFHPLLRDIFSLNTEQEISAYHISLSLILLLFNDLRQETWTGNCVIIAFQIEQLFNHPLKFTREFLSILDFTAFKELPKNIPFAQAIEGLFQAPFSKTYLLAGLSICSAEIISLNTGQNSMKSSFIEFLMNLFPEEILQQKNVSRTLSSLLSESIYMGIYDPQMMHYNSEDKNLTFGKYNQIIHDVSAHLAPQFFNLISNNVKLLLSCDYDEFIECEKITQLTQFFEDIFAAIVRSYDLDRLLQPPCLAHEMYLRFKTYLKKYKALAVAKYIDQLQELGNLFLPSEGFFEGDLNAFCEAKVRNLSGCKNLLIALNELSLDYDEVAKEKILISHKKHSWTLSFSDLQYYKDINFHKFMLESEKKGDALLAQKVSPLFLMRLFRKLSLDLSPADFKGLTKAELFVSLKTQEGADQKKIQELFNHFLYKLEVNEELIEKISHAWGLSAELNKKLFTWLGGVNLLVNPVTLAEQLYYFMIHKRVGRSGRVEIARSLHEIGNLPLFLPLGDTNWMKLTNRFSHVLTSLSYNILNKTLECYEGSIPLKLKECEFTLYKLK